MHSKSIVCMSPLHHGGKAVFLPEAISLRRRVGPQPCARGLIGASAKRARGSSLSSPPAGSGQLRHRRPYADCGLERRRWRRMRLCRAALPAKAGPLRSTRISRAILAATPRASMTIRPERRTTRKRGADISNDDPTDEPLFAKTSDGWRGSATSRHSFRGYRCCRRWQDVSSCRSGLSVQR